MSASASDLRPSFRHEALLYNDQATFVEGTVPFIRDGLAAGEPVLVLETAQNIGLLRSALGQDADQVHFGDMADVGSNPARIIPAWREFAAQRRGQRLRGIGEPIWNGRRPTELIECQRHEALLNPAFASGVEMWLLCPYDTKELPPAVIAEARHSHPFIVDGTGSRQSTEYRNPPALFDAALSDSPIESREHRIEPSTLTMLRTVVTAAATQAGLEQERIANIVMATNEVATNSLQHGGGHGTLRHWRDDGALIIEIRDRGAFDRLLVDRERPGSDVEASRGLWLTNQLCDLVQIRSYSRETVVRLHMWC
jgi:anti-sigma regulatory factor (Ser/Thr protein kinase)